MKPIVAIIMGSDSDLPIMQNTCGILEDFAVPFEVKILSAHRTPELLKEYLAGFERAGGKIIIAAAGSAAHLAGSIAAHTTLPILGVPIPVPPFEGLDSLLSTVQMPAGIPVLTLAVGKGGAVNAAIATVEILALADRGLAKKLAAYRKTMVKKIQDKNNQLEKLGVSDYIIQSKEKSSPQKKKG